ncbi:MAG: hypothetical protein IPM06_05635 [Rhizobiales bacterium]|nr:hypothetical protein [Hyphomicrobiales bacterium]
MNDRDLVAIRQAGLIDQKQFDAIAAFLHHQPAAVQAPRFDLTHLLWYAGALIVIAAMGIFTNEAFNRMGGMALMLCGIAYALAFAIAGHVLWNRPGLRTPGGLLIAVAVAMVPLIVYGLQDWLQLWDYAQGNPGDYNDFYPYVNGSWLYMELATVLVGIMAVARYRFPFILMMAAVALWFMSMDLALWFTRSPLAYGDFDTRRAVSMWFGLALMLAAWIADLRRKDGPDMTFWIHIAAAAAFWGGLSLHDGGTQLDKFLYCLVNVALLAYSLFIDRRIYAVFGALGIAGYLGYLASDVFQDTIIFSFALSAIGIAVIAVGLFTHKNRPRLKAWFDSALPSGLRSLRPRPAP